MLFRLAAGAAVFLALAGSAAAAPVHCIPTERGDGDTPIVMAKVHGQGPFAFVLDTAASGTTIDDRLVERLKPRRNEREEKAEGLGGPMDVKLYIVESFEFGPVAAHGFTAPGIPAPPFESHDVHGLIGVETFGADTLVWAAGTGCVGLTDRQGVAPDAPPTFANAEWLPWRDDWRTVKVDWIRPWKIMLPVKIGGVEGWGLLDTGAQWTVLNPAFAAKLGLEDGSLRPGGEISGIDGRPMPLSETDLNAVSIGAWFWDARTVRIGDMPVFARLGDPEQPLAVIGMDWLKDASFAIDYDNEVVWQQPLGPTSVTATPSPPGDRE